MLGMAFFKSLIKEHGKTYFEPIGKALQAAGIKKPNMMNPAHAWALRSALVPYGEVAAGRGDDASRSARVPGRPAATGRARRSSPPRASSAAGWRSATS